MLEQVDVFYQGWGERWLWGRLMSPTGEWRLAPAYDVTFCEGPGGYHQMDVMGEALTVGRPELLGLAEEAEVPAEVAGQIIDRFCDVASQFAAIADELSGHRITRDTLNMIQGRIDQNIERLR